ncbi:hypothetical protein ACFL34_02940 [Candidatus Sumerlaeota bacterium]
MQHTFYKSFLSQQAKAVKRRRGVYAALSKREVRVMGPEDLAAYAALSTIACDDAGICLRSIVLYEWTLHKMGNPTIFIETPELVDALLKANFRIHHSSIILPNKKGFSYFAFPHRTVVSGVELCGCFFGTPPSEQIEHALEALNCTFGTSLALGDKHANLSERFLVGLRNSNNGFMMRSINQSELSLAMNNGVNQYAPDTPERCVSEGDKRLEDALFRLCAAACIYAQAFPEHVRPGYPEVKISNGTRPSRPIKTVTTLGSPQQNHGSAKCLHIRNGHFRSLANKRFKRNPDGSIKVVFVKASVIGGKIEPTTVEEGAVIKQEMKILQGHAA